MDNLNDSPAPTWEYQQGLIELVEAGYRFSEIEDQLQQGNLSLPKSTRGASTQKLETLIKWLQGFRRKETIYKDERVYFPFIELWAPPGGKAQFQYELTTDDSLAAEINLFSFSGFGGSSKRKITESIKMNTEGNGRLFSLGVLLTVMRYQHKDDITRSFDKIDVRGIQDGFDFKIHDLSPQNFILPQQEINESLLVPDEYSNIRFFRLAHSNQKMSDTYSPSTEESTDWSFNLSMPLLKQGIKMGISTKNSKAMKASFDCPTGYDYAFFTRFGESQPVPYCARLLK
jgi:hypothetical protein